MTASLSVMAVVIVGLLPVHPGAAGAADPKGFFVMVTDRGFSPSVVSDVNPGDVLIFTLYRTTNRHSVVFEDSSICAGSRGAVPCWPELRFDDGQPNCTTDQGPLQDSRCMVVRDPGKTVRFHDGSNQSSAGEVRVLGEPTTTTGAPTPPTEPTPSPTEPSTTTTTAAQATTTTAPGQIHPFLVPDAPATTSTTTAVIPVVATRNGTPPSTTTKDKDKEKDKPRPKADGTATPSTAPPADSGSMPPDSVFDPASLTPGPVAVPDMTGLSTAGNDGSNLESSAVMNLLDHEEPAEDGPVLLAAVALAFLLLVAGVWRWLHRASRYDPA